MTAINSNSTELDRMEIQIPSDLILQLINSTVESVRLGSFLYSNISGLFPASVSGRPDLK